MLVVVRLALPLVRLALLRGRRLFGLPLVLGLGWKKRGKER